MGRAVLPALPWPEAAWELVLLDSPDEEAYLFADGAIYLTRGLLPALGSMDRLEALLGEASRLYLSGAFRPGPDRELVAQPLRLVIPEGDPAALGESREAWLELLDGLPYGHAPEFGAAIGGELRLPLADLRLTVPDGMRLEPRGRGHFAGLATGEEALPALEVRADAGLGSPTAPAAGARSEPGGDGFGGDFPSPAEERALLGRLADLLSGSAASAGRALDTLEAIRVRGFTGVRARWRDGPPPASADPGMPAGLAAVLATPGPPVEFWFACGPRPFAVCEAEFLAVIRTAERMFRPPLPGWRRLAAVPVDEAGPARAALEERAASGAAAAPLAALFELNRDWLDSRLDAGDRVLVVVRDGEDGS